MKSTGKHHTCIIVPPFSVLFCLDFVVVYTAKMSTSISFVSVAVGLYLGHASSVTQPCFLFVISTTHNCMEMNRSGPVTFSDPRVVQTLDTPNAVPRALSI